MELGNTKKIVCGNFNFAAYQHHPDPLILHLVLWIKIVRIPGKSSSVMILS